jgi:hypothetical protein
MLDSNMLLVVKQLTASHEAREGKQLEAECPGVYAMCRDQNVQQGSGREVPSGRHELPVCSAFLDRERRRLRFNHERWNNITTKKDGSIPSSMGHMRVRSSFLLGR